jgi:hypothetical protein
MCMVQVREQLISDLQARIEEDFERWQTAVNTAVNNRKKDDERFQVRLPPSATSCGSCWSVLFLVWPDSVFFCPPGRRPFTRLASPLFSLIAVMLTCRGKWC